MYLNIVELHLDCEIGKGLHKMIFPSLELKEDEIDVECYKCESIVSSGDNVFDSYRIGLEKIEEYIKPKENKNMLKDILTEEDKDQQGQLVKNLTDLALLSQGLLKGNELTTFINRNVEMMEGKATKPKSKIITEI